MAGRSAVKKVGQLGFCRLLGFIALGALVLRLIARWQHGTANYWDEGYGFYFNIARNLAQGRGYELVAGKLTAFRVPGYPIFLLAITGGDWHPWTIVTVQAVIGALSVAATGLIGRELFGGRTGLIAAGTCALYPYYVIHDTALQETALVTCLSAWGTFLLLRMARTGSLWLALFAGAMLAAAVLTRETVLPFALCAALWAGWRVAALNGVARGVLASAGLLTVLGAGLTPWLLHTQHEYGEYVLGNEFGAALYAGSDPLLFTAYPDGSVDDSRDLIFRAISPLDQAKLARFKGYPRVRDNLLRDRAIERIEADPIGFSWRFARKVWIAFRPLPSPLHSALSNLVYALVWLPLLLLGLTGLWQSRAQWRRDSLIYAQFAAFVVISGTLWAQTAHRVFLDLYLMIYAAGLVSSWLGIRALRPPVELCQGTAQDGHN